MKGIISRVLAIKDLYDNMAEDLKPYFFDSYGDRWYLRERSGSEKFHVGLDPRGDWYILYGHDAENSCELVFCTDEKTGDMVPAEYTVWNHWDEKSYHRVFREFF